VVSTPKHDYIHILDKYLFLSKYSGIYSPSIRNKLSITTISGRARLGVLGVEGPKARRIRVEYIERIRPLSS
jgi:hypothetical protein